MLDPVHKWIEIDPLCLKIIDTPLFQRLGHIRQLTSAQYVFPDARHTRKEHSIGAMHIANKYLSSVFNKIQLSKEKKEEITQGLRIAALLHDISHGPYSHTWDATVFSKIYNSHKGHDLHRHKIIEYYNDLFNVNYIKDIWNGNYKYLSAIIQGPLSVDRMDFTKRDSYYTGVQYGIFDIDRITSNCWFEKLKNKIVLVYDSKIVNSALQGLNTRLYMYEEIYLNKNVIAASILIDCMINEASKNINFLDKDFVYLNDASVFYEILNSDNEEAKKYAKMLYERKLPKMISEKKIIGKANPRTEILENGNIKWISRSLNKNFIEEFSKYDIHIRKKEKLYTFEQYCKLQSIEISDEKYYFERIYACE